MKLCTLLFLLTVLIFSAAAALAYKGEQLAPQAKVTLDQARAIALKAVPGTITDEELESERGGSGLRYSFDIKTGSTTHEVGVDALTGTLLENSIEGARPD
ncbi:MAG TPA: PepSY domain-containing protein [Nitrospira sp.]|nr:PepSY domain-containing protein [Nitrospira sp.]